MHIYKLIRLQSIWWDSEDFQKVVTYVLLTFLNSADDLPIKKKKHTLLFLYLVYKIDVMKIDVIK